MSDTKLLKKYTGQMQAAALRYEVELQRITNAMFTDVVVPTCKKHGWEFAAGMGTWSFYKDGNPLWMVEDGVPLDVVEILNLETVYNGQSIGSLIEKDYPGSMAADDVQLFDDV